MAVWFVARSLLRQRFRSLVGLALVLAILGGLGLGAIAGARRTQSSYPRFKRWDRTSTLSIDTGEDLALLRKAERLPQVVSHRRYAALDIALVKDGKPDLDLGFEALVSMDGRYFDQDTFVPTEGRLPDPTKRGEVAMNRFAADTLGLRLNQWLDLGVYDDREVSQSEDPSSLEPVMRERVRIVGIGLFPEEVVQDESDRSSLVLFTPAFERHAHRWVTYFWSGLVLRHGDANVEAFKVAYRKLLPTGYPEFYRVGSTFTYHAQQAIRPLSLALALFGAVSLGAAVLLTILALSRELGLLAEERRILRALGFDGRQLVVATVAGPLSLMLAGVIGAVGLALALSPTMPLGPVRAVEPDRGVSFDWTILGLGSLVAMGLLVATGVVIAVSAIAADVRSRSASVAKTGLSQLGSRLGLGVSGTLGLHSAFDPGAGRSRAGVRSVVLATTVAVACLVSALTFSASLDRLVQRPALYGWNWDVAAIDEAGYSNMPRARAAKVLDGNPDIAAWGGYNFGSGALDGVTVPMLGSQPSGALGPAITSGRAPVGTREVALGSATARELHREVGDTVRVRSDLGIRRLRVVGIAVFPTVGVVHGDHTSLGIGAWLAASSIPGISRRTEAGEPVGPNIVFVRFRNDIDRSAAIRRFKRTIPSLNPRGTATFLDVQRPGEIVNTTDLGSAPAVLASLLALGSIIALGLMLAGSVRRRRRDLAVLRALGGTSGQLRSTVLWQSMATVTAGLLLGVPLGLVAGRFAWTRFAHQLQVVPRATVPALAVGGLAVVTLLVANLVAIGPGIAAARTPASRALRAE